MKRGIMELHKVRFDGSHLLGAFAGGAGAFALLISALPIRSAVSPSEMRTLVVAVRPGLAFPGREYFGPYSCTDDCSGHYAGWSWAQAEGLKDANGCDGIGASHSFHEGCRYYLEVLGVRKADS